MENSEFSSLPVIRTWHSLFTEPLPNAPIQIQLTENEWKRLSAGAVLRKSAPPKDAKGLAVYASPFSGFGVIPTCAGTTNPNKGIHCIAILTGGGLGGGPIAFTGHCKCFFNYKPKKPKLLKLPDDRLPPLGCSPSFKANGAMTCIGGCKNRNAKCAKAIYPWPGSKGFLTCACT